MATAVEVRDPDEVPIPSTTGQPVTIAITPRPIADDEFRIIGDIGDIPETAACSCNAGDDNPY
jgi:hypothetical protein